MVDDIELVRYRDIVRECLQTCNDTKENELLVRLRLYIKKNKHRIHSTSYWPCFLNKQTGEKSIDLAQ
jgi:hypothetical protein